MKSEETKYGWLSRYDLVPAFDPISKDIRENLVFALSKAGLDPTLPNGFVTTPGLPGYCTPVIRSGDQLVATAAHVTASFRGLVADVWTQLLVSKRDAKEKDIYLFWDDEIPQPTEETALA